MTREEWREQALKGMMACSRAGYSCDWLFQKWEDIVPMRLAFQTTDHRNGWLTFINLSIPKGPKETKFDAIVAYLWENFEYEMEDFLELNE